MSQIDYYDILGVSEDANPERIKAAYRELALRYHPDRNRDQPEAADRMKAVNEAYAVLSNPAKRREYDAMRTRFGASAHDQFRTRYSEGDIFRDSDISDILDEIARNFGLRGFEDILREIDGRGVRFEFKAGGGPAGPGQAVGVGWLSGWLGGKLLRSLFESVFGRPLPEPGADVVEPVRLSPETAKTGGPFAYHHRRLDKRLVVHIPPGIRAGQKIRLAGLGEPGRGGARPGDLYLDVEIRKPLLGRIGDFVGGLFR
jgi:DnaJ-class molecular chaperone